MERLVLTTAGRSTPPSLPPGGARANRGSDRRPDNSHLVAPPLVTCDSGAASVLPQMFPAAADAAAGGVTSGSSSSSTRPQQHQRQPPPQQRSKHYLADDALRVNKTSFLRSVEVSAGWHGYYGSHQKCGGGGWSTGSKPVWSNLAPLCIPNKSRCGGVVCCCCRRRGL